ncbi:hypothetical protein B0H19DRAFT_1077646 [Mycena capillaripes]|nr:hypothetical protein B0H19DRAFT_1077646 [Mycena capillaripes]
MPPQKSSLDLKVKKPRHRHSAVQLAALNGLYEQTEHPTLAQRTALAQSLGLETKSVNAYFQNKRASSKKQPRGSPYDAPGQPPSHPTPWSTADDDNYYYPPTEEVSNHNLRSAPHLDQDPRPRNQLSSAPDHAQYLPQPGPPSRLQIDELQRIYRNNPYPEPEEVRVVAERIGMRHQTTVEWFRTQRNLDRRSIDVYPIGAAGERQTFSCIPPITAHIHTPPASSHPSLVGIDSTTRLSAVPEDQYYAARTSRRSASPRNAAPYGSTSTALSLSARQRRGRPDPFQLNSLRRLLSKTPTPSIEERSALALEIGMDLGKVTNWFRNLRQSARKREKKPESHHHRLGPGTSDDDFEYNDHEPVYLSSTSRSRSETPRTSSIERDVADYYGRRRRGPVFPHSTDDEEEEAQEAVTPSSSPSPSWGRPPDLVHLDEKAAAQAQFSSSGVPYEDAMLLLSFHRRAGMF